MELTAPHERYLRLLGLDRTPPREEALNELVRAHLCRVPFENVSKLLLVGREGSGRLTTLDEFLDGVEHRDLGGTCYTLAPFFCSLLRGLGYDARLYGADMSEPNAHILTRVRLGGSDYHVDIGYAAPFSRAFRVDGAEVTIPHGPLVYRIRPDGADTLQGNERVHFYKVHGPPRDIDFFRNRILASYLPGRTFMRQLRITRHFADYTMELRTTRILRIEGGSCREWKIASAAELERAIAEDFAMPRCPIREAVETLERITATSLWNLPTGL